MSQNKKSEGVSIGNVTGGIHSSVIAGRDVKNVTIGGQPVSTDKTPTQDEYRQLLTEIRAILAELASQQELMKDISPATPTLVQAADESIKQVEQTIHDEPKMSGKSVEGVQKTITDAAGLIGIVLENANNLASRAIDTGKTIGPFLEKLGPLLDKLSVAALWAAKLWLT